ncbi:MAG: hypothetical protein ABIT47_04150 [Candidatus Paceibacterota bacterium]
MDTPTTVPQLFQTDKHRTLKGVALAIIVIAALVTIVEFGIPLLHNKANSTAFAVSIGPVPVSVLYTIDAKTNTFLPLTVRTDDGKELYAVDVQKGLNGSWYYILTESLTSSLGNLYVKKADGSVTKLTDSATIKYNLSFDPNSGKLAYQSKKSTRISANFAENQKWDLTVYDASLNSETIVGEGLNPHLSADGVSVIFQHGNILEAIALGSRATSTVMKLATGDLYAVSNDATLLSVYNSRTHQIDTFALTHGVSPSYVSSDDVSLTPALIGYVG